MKAVLVVAACLLAVCVAQPATRQEDWRCGNPASLPSVANLRYTGKKPGIVLLQGPEGHGSLDYIRVEEAQSLTDPEAQKRYHSKTWDNLFCSEYVGRYRAPPQKSLTEQERLEGAAAGVCITDTQSGKRWEAILEADEKARMWWTEFGTKYDYQKSNAVYKEAAADDNNVLWGSGRSGSSPANWCSEYMKEMMCHMAFPQLADTLVKAKSTTVLPNGAELCAGGSCAPGFGARVRPVCQDFCLSVMDICNRKEPDDYSSSYVLEWIPDNSQFPGHTEAELEDRTHKTTNKLYCNMWNSGFGVAAAGTGTTGDDAGGNLYCADWDAAPSFTASFALLVALLALVML